MRSEADKDLYGYLCTYKERTKEVYANTLYEAQIKAASLLQVLDKNRYKISVSLCERKDGTLVVQTIS